MNSMTYRVVMSEAILVFVSGRGSTIDELYV